MRMYKTNCFSYVERNGVGTCRGTINETCSRCVFYKDRREYIKECQRLYGEDWGDYCATEVIR